MRFRILLFCAVAGFTQNAIAAPLDKVEHIVVIVLENHSFDNLFGLFADAEGLNEAKKAKPQQDMQGKVYDTLPSVMAAGGKMDARFPAQLANAPFPIENYVAARERTLDPTHRFFEQQAQIHGGAMDQFAARSNAGGLVMGYYDGSSLGLWDYAKRFTLADHFFAAAFGGSLINHFWLVCACTPRFEHAPKDMRIQLNEDGSTRGAVTDDGYVVETAFPFNTPHPKHMEGSPKLVPAQEMITIADRLEEKKIDWAWYSGGWIDAVAGKADKLFQFHHQPFVFFKGFEEGSARRKAHLKDATDFLRDVKQGTLPAVSFYKPLGEFNLHPGYTNVSGGDEHIVSVLKAIEHSPQWASTVVIVTFDENGGYWDHVSPPKGDRWGPGVRVPTLIISPLAKKGFVDHTVYDTTSILKLIEVTFGLKPLGERDKKAADMRQAFMP